MTHNYWAIMGSIAADTAEQERFLPEGCRPLFASSGISMLLRYEPDLIPDVSEDDIKDKSKGGSLTKALHASKQGLYKRPSKCLAGTEKR